MSEIANSEMPILSLHGVSKLYGSTTAVDNVSFEVRRGEVVTLLGHSGSGKSTTLRMIAGLERPTAGSIELRGTTVACAEKGTFVPAERRGIGLVFQSYAVWPHMSVGENIGYPLRVRKVPKADVRERVAKTCELVGMSDFIDRPATQLSGGQQQRVALGRAIIHEPDLLLLDEPFSNLDTQLREELRHYMKRLQRRLEMSVLYVTHDQVEAMDLSDRVAVMYNGAIEQLDEPRNVYEHSANFFIQRFVGKLLTLEGRVEALGSSEAEVQLADGSLLSRPVPSRPLEKGMAVRVCVRPEDAKVQAPDAVVTALSLQAEVLELDYLGSYQDCRLAVGGTEVVLAVDKAARLEIGERVSLAFAPDRVHIWPMDRK